MLFRIQNYISIQFSILLLALFPVYCFGQINQTDVEEFTRKTAYQLKRPLEEITSLINSASYQSDIIDKMNKPYEKTMTWERYRNIFMKPERIEAGLKFWKDNEEVLNEVSSASGVDIEAIIGILGVETYFGQRMGNYKVLDALYTLAFGYPRRSSFFKAELSKFIELCQKEGLDPLTIKGSYAGAMGYGQFMPSSYLAYAKSYDEETGADMMNDAYDGIASVANYLKIHRWETGGRIATKAKMSKGAESLTKQKTKPSNPLSYYVNKGYEPEVDINIETLASLQVMTMEDQSVEHWITFKNFYVITRYNQSPLYALAVYQLGEAVKKAYQVSQ